MKFEQGRTFMKSQWTQGPMKDTDQINGVPMPPFEDPFDETKLIALPNPKTTDIKQRDIVELLSTRQSRRKLGARELTMNELSFLLWAVQGMRDSKGGRIFRTVPSAGSRHPFETYLYADKVTGLTPGLYRYIATKNAILPVSFEVGLKDGLSDALHKQWFNCGVALFWVFNAYRCEWRYTHHSHKISTIDVGHIGQNGYLAAEALGIGCCAIGAYSQDDLDKLLEVDGEDEFSCYIEVFGAYE